MREVRGGREPRAPVLNNDTQPGAREQRAPAADGGPEAPVARVGSAPAARIQAPQQARERAGRLCQQQEAAGRQRGRQVRKRLWRASRFSQAPTGGK